MTEDQGWPVLWTFGTTSGPDGSTWVSLSVNLPFGVFTTGMPPDVAEAMADSFPNELRKAAKAVRRAQSGIVVASTLPKHPLGKV